MATGNEKLILQFLEDGFTYMFGNPGTVEEGLLYELQKTNNVKYITCLQESIAVAMADGYARKAKRPALVQLHSGVGLGNGIGMMYQALRGNCPLVVIAGDAGVQYDAMDAQMACDLVSMARPVTKWANRVTHSNSLLRMFRRAVKIAMTPPMGPVFLALPMDVLDSENTEEVYPSLHLSTPSIPHENDLKQAAQWLSNAENPMFIIGDGIVQSDATEQLETLASTIGAKVWGANDSEVNCSALHPCFCGQLGHMFGKNSKQKIETADVVLVCGTYLLPEVFPDVGNIFKANTKVIHIDNDPADIAKNHRVDLAMVAHPKYALSALKDMLAQTMDDYSIQRALDRRNELTDRTPQNFDDGSILSEFIKQLSNKITNPIIFDEALTASGTLRSYFPPAKCGQYFQTRGGSLGVGIPGASGIKLAAPEETVIAFTGDGGSMYTIQSIYTAVRYNINVKFVICNNGSYQLLKDNITQYWDDKKQTCRIMPDSFDLVPPSIDFVRLAQSMGADGCTVRCKDDIDNAVDKLIHSATSFVVDLSTMK